MIFSCSSPLPHPSFRPVITSSEVFKPCNKAMLYLIMGLLEPRLFMTEDRLFQVDCIVPAMFFIKTGTVELLPNPMISAFRKITLEDGSLCGEAALFGWPQPRTAKASEPCDVFALTQSSFQNFLDVYAEAFPQLQTELEASVKKSMQSLGGKISLQMLKNHGSMARVHEVVEVVEGSDPFAIGGLKGVAESNEEEEASVRATGGGKGDSVAPVPASEAEEKKDRGSKGKKGDGNDETRAPEKVENEGGKAATPDSKVGNSDSGAEKALKEDGGQ